MRSSIINDENAITQQLKQKHLLSSSTTKSTSSNLNLNSNENISSSTATTSHNIPNKTATQPTSQQTKPSTSSTRDIISKYKREVLKELSVNELKNKQSQQYQPSHIHSSSLDYHHQNIQKQHNQHQQNEVKTQTQYNHDPSDTQNDQSNSYKKPRISSSDELFEYPKDSQQSRSSVQIHNENEIYESKFKEEEEDFENREPRYEIREEIESDIEEEVKEEQPEQVERIDEDVRKQILLQQRRQLQNKLNQTYNQQRQDQLVQNQQSQQQHHQQQHHQQHHHHHYRSQQQTIHDRLYTRRISNPTGIIYKYKRSIMIPPWTESIQKELDLINSDPRFKTWDLVNGEDWNDPTMVCEYSKEIFEYMGYLEIKYNPDPFYMERCQEELKWDMRSVLNDWIVQIHNKFNLLPETLFLSINIIDRFLSKRKVSMTKLQLVGAVALLIAAKYEEINIPTIKEVIHMTDNCFTVDEFTKAECYMIDSLEFDLGWPGPMSFLRRISKADEYDYETRTLAKYFLEITIMDSRFVSSPTSWLAAGAHYLSRFLLNKGEWTDAHVYFSGYCERQVAPLAEQLLDNCKYPEKNHKAIFEKYSERRFRRSSLFVQDYLEHVYGIRREVNE
ncbi:CLB4 [Candida pseudojiufengensis]|uniref:CLB4 n=1 Tax=Candida pseudojiufengensis TaxID=497109 RepID=UPI0022257535|nr:CLB4 [Candida pseudojiufengensis]KAI5959817.1 CLB4 [Candida pseudojiufengensis]